MTSPKGSSFAASGSWAHTASSYPASTDVMRDRLRAYGLFAEIISWKLRMFVPSDVRGVEVLSRVLDHYPIERIGEREAA